MCVEACVALVLFLIVFVYIVLANVFALLMAMVRRLFVFCVFCRHVGDRWVHCYLFVFVNSFFLNIAGLCESFFD